ncbi:hypothetical protein ACOSQ2_024430 [Xanthoceras sorbifolium]
MSKTYDCVEWRFFRLVLVKLGFPSQWISRILDCFSSVGFSFVVNESLVGEVFPSRGVRQGCLLSPYLFIFPSRGVRQGCLLSPYLFILCAEAFSFLVRGTEQDRRVLGVRYCRDSPLVSHLFFANDCVLFCKAELDCCAALKDMLNVYEKGSGQLINF